MISMGSPGMSRCWHRRWQAAQSRRGQTRIAGQGRVHLTPFRIVASTSSGGEKDTSPWLSTVFRWPTLGTAGRAAKAGCEQAAREQTLTSTKARQLAIQHARAAAACAVCFAPEMVETPKVPERPGSSVSLISSNASLKGTSPSSVSLSVPSGRPAARQQGSSLQGMKGNRKKLNSTTALVQALPLTRQVQHVSGGQHELGAHGMHQLAAATNRGHILAIQVAQACSTVWGGRG